MNQMNQPSIYRPVALLVAVPILAFGAAFLVASSSSVIADEYEWDPSSGYHEEEWYDPGDWLNEDDALEYENDYYGSYYDGDVYGGDETWFGDNYYTDEWSDDESDFDHWYDASEYSDDAFNIREEYEEIDREPGIR